MKVAVLDTGIDTDHPDLADSIWGEGCGLPRVPVDQCPPFPHVAEDDNGHGTHVSGIITSNGNNGLASVGVAPGAQIFAYKVLFADGSTTSELYGLALDKILHNFPGVFQFINMSFGDHGSHSASECASLLPAFETTIHMLKETGTLAFASSGNEGFKSGIAFPACIDDVVSVGAVYDLDYSLVYWGDASCIDAVGVGTGHPAWRGRVGCGSNSSPELDLTAPGVGILSDWPTGYGVVELTGTSMASPHAVGVAALLKQAMPDLTPDELLARLKSTGEPALDDLHDSDAATNRYTPRVDARAAIGAGTAAVGGIARLPEIGRPPSEASGTTSAHATILRGLMIVVAFAASVAMIVATWRIKRRRTT